MGRHTTRRGRPFTICIHVTNHRHREGKLRTAYLGGLKSKGAAHVWIALGFVYRISEVQTASYKALCTRKVLRQDKSKFYRGFPVSRPILNSYTKPTLLHTAHPYCHYVWTPFITVSVTFSQTLWSLSLVYKTLNVRTEPHCMLNVRLRNAAQTLLHLPNFSQISGPEMRVNF